MFHHLDFGGLLVCYTWLSIELITVEIISVICCNFFQVQLQNDWTISRLSDIGMIILSICLSVCLWCWVVA